jgi:hypothetical protein
MAFFILDQDRKPDNTVSYPHPNTAGTLCKENSKETADKVINPSSSCSQRKKKFLEFLISVPHIEGIINLPFKN